MVKKVISVDLGGTNIRAALATSDGTLLHVVRTPTEAELGRKQVITRIENAILEAAQDDWNEVTGIGMVAPGPLDPWKGTLVYAPNLGGWRDVPLKEIFETSLKKPVRIGNDANLAALAEHQFGAGKGVENLIYITVSTGIGGGIIVNNQLLLGAKGYGAEVGQIVLDMKGERHTSGVRGSVEGMAAGPAIAQRARRLVSDSQGQGILSVAGSVEAITAKHVGLAALQGDKLAQELLNQAGEIVGYSLVSLLSIFNPQIVIVGGGVSNVGKIFLNAVQSVIQDNLHSVYWEDCPIVPVSLGDDVGLLGGVALLNSPE